MTELYTYPCLPDMTGKSLFLVLAFSCGPNFAGTKLNKVKHSNLFNLYNITVQVQEQDTK